MVQLQSCPESKTNSIDLECAFRSLRTRIVIKNKTKIGHIKNLVLVGSLLTMSFREVCLLVHNLELWYLISYLFMNFVLLA